MRLPTLILILIAVACAGSATHAAPRSSSGRFLYANDDDWDWASPAKGNTPSALAAEYHAMRWSALDWVTAGLSSVRGVAIGTLPDDSLGVDQLAKLRGERWTQHPATAGVITELLAGDRAPNVILLMRNSMLDPAPELSAKDGAALAAFVSRGGRLIVLDDWGVYTPVLDALTGAQPSSPHSLPTRIATPGPTPRRVRQPASDRTEVTDAAVEALVARFEDRGATAEIASIVRDGTHRAGRALRVEIGLAPAIAR